MAGAFRERVKLPVSQLHVSGKGGIDALLLVDHSPASCNRVVTTHRDIGVLGDLNAVFARFRASSDSLAGRS